MRPLEFESPHSNDERGGAARRQVEPERGPDGRMLSTITDDEILRMARHYEARQLSPTQRAEIARKQRIESDLDAIIAFVERDPGDCAAGCRCALCLVDACERSNESVGFIDRDDPAFRAALERAMEYIRTFERRRRRLLADRIAAHIYAGTFPRDATSDRSAD